MFIDIQIANLVDFRDNIDFLKLRNFVRMIYIEDFMDMFYIDDFSDDFCDVFRDIFV